MGAAVPLLAALGRELDELAMETGPPSAALTRLAVLRLAERHGSRLATSLSRSASATLNFAADRRFLVSGLNIAQDFAGAARSGG